MKDPVASRRRLEAVAELVPWGARVADIGTDHLVLPRYLIWSGRAAFCVATERTARGAREAQNRLARGRPLAGIEIRQGDGLAPLVPTDRLDLLILAGLGARSILCILDRGNPRRLGVARLVLQPQTEPGLLRSGLAQRGFGIVDERLGVERGRYYPVIAAEPSAADRFSQHPLLDREDLAQVGPCLVRCGDPAVAALWREVRSAQSKALLRAVGPGRSAAQRRLEQAERILVAIAGRSV